MSGDAPVPEEGEKKARGQLLAECAVAPSLRHAIASQPFSAPIMGGEVSWDDTVNALADRFRRVEAGDRRVVSDMLLAQAVTLDTIFTEMLRRSGNNLGDYPEAAERYMRLALKAQSNSRATMEALVRLHQPREQTVKHVHVNSGGQAVVADEFHHHTGGHNVENAEQPHEQAADAALAALSGPDPTRDGVPLPCDEGKEAVPVARREIDRSAEG